MNRAKLKSVLPTTCIVRAKFLKGEGSGVNNLNPWSNISVDEKE